MPSYVQEFRVVLSYRCQRRGTVGEIPTLNYKFVFSPKLTELNDEAALESSSILSLARSSLHTSQ